MATDPPARRVVLSDTLKAIWREANEAAPKRSDLQRLGDTLRETSGRGALVARALRDAEVEPQSHQRIVIDSLRNVGEVEYLRERFGERFFLVAIDAPGPVRWERVRDVYEARGEGQRDFLADDTRDQNEETPHGQQVQLCVDRADIFVSNAKQQAPVQATEELREKLRGFLDLVTGVRPRYPTQLEVLMNLAYSSAHSTKCLKRQVGAVIATDAGEPISVGYNENPDAIQPCVFEFKECYRDRIRNDHFQSLAGRVSCPACAELIPAMVGPPWRCTCGANLERFFFPDRAMKWCTALHAEERAIINAKGRDLRGTVLYTTAFPCFLCAEKILQARIGRIVFAEPYPDAFSSELLDRANHPIEVERFEGVRSGSFDRIFGRIREEREQEIDDARRAAFAVRPDL